MISGKRRRERRGANDKIDTVSLIDRLIDGCRPFTGAIRRRKKSVK